MAFVQFDKIGISGLAAAVPANRIDNSTYTEYFSSEEAAQIVEKTGIKFRRFAPEGICASDLCVAAAKTLLDNKKLDKSEVDALIFVSQTPDYRMPATSILLQHKLGFNKNTAAFDVSLGCSGFVYGLMIAYSLVNNGGFRKVLLLDGETRSRVYSPKDRKTAFLFGDGGVAALIERDQDCGTSFFSLGSDGSREDYIKMDAGGYRIPSSIETLKEKVVDEHGNIRSDEHGYMNGTDVFNFVLSEIPSNINGLLSYAGISAEAIDYFLFHQANDYMNSYLIKKMKLPVEKVPQSIRDFGNTSSVSIPLTIVSQLEKELQLPKTLLLSGFGVGMSWASAILPFRNCTIPPLVEL